MPSEISRPDKSDDRPAHLLEVDFALVVARMIDTVKLDPSQLRTVVYELARAKLREEITWADKDEEDRHLRALETAIRGVENFSRRADQTKALPNLSWSSPVASISYPMPPSREPIISIDQAKRDSDTPSSSRPPQFGRRRTKYPFKPIWLRAGVFLVVVILAGTFAKNYMPISLSNKLILVPFSGKSVSSIVSEAPAMPLPTVYGIYALNDG